MRNIFLIFSVIAFTLVFYGCHKSSQLGPSNSASVMFVDACPGSASIVLKDNNNFVNGYGVIDLFTTSGYLYLTPDKPISLNYYLPTGAALCHDTVNLSIGAHYTAFAAGLTTNPSFILTNDEMTTPSKGNAEIRFINLANDTLNESYYIDSQAMDSNVRYTFCTPFVQIPATNNATVLAADPMYPSSPYVAQLTNQAFVAGKVYTIMLTGTFRVKTDNPSFLTLTVIKNN